MRPALYVRAVGGVSTLALAAGCSQPDGGRATRPAPVGRPSSTVAAATPTDLAHAGPRWGPCLGIRSQDDVRELTKHNPDGAFAVIATVPSTTPSAGALGPRETLVTYPLEDVRQVAGRPRSRLPAHVEAALADTQDPAAWLPAGRYLLLVGARRGGAYTMGGMRGQFVLDGDRSPLQRCLDDDDPAVAQTAPPTGLTLRETIAVIEATVD